MEKQETPQGMWDSYDGTDCSRLSRLDWQKSGFRMEPNAAEHLRGVDDGNDPGYIPEAGSYVHKLQNRPFSDGMVDPSMVDNRSDNLRGHMGGFWNEKEEQTAAPGEEEKAEEKEKTRRLPFPAKQMKKWGIALAVTASVLLVLRFAVLNVQTIAVVGENVSRETADRVREAVGIRRGSNILLVNDAEVENAVNDLSFVQFDALEKKLHRVTIHVKQREVQTYIWNCGVIYTLDAHGNVLNECMRDDVIPDYPQVEGLNIRYCAVGSPLLLNDDKQMPVYREFARELRVMQLSQVVRDIYLTDIDNIYLGTAGGFSVRMGDATRIHAKLRALTLVLAYLEENRQPTGTIDVSTPESPTYIPTASL